MNKINDRYYLTKTDVERDLLLDLPSLFSEEGIYQSKRVDYFLKRVSMAVYNFILTSTHNGQSMVDLFNSNEDDVKYCLEEQCNYMALVGDFGLMSGYVDKSTLLDRQKLRESKISDNVVTYLLAKGYLYSGYCEV